MHSHTWYANLGGHLAKLIHAIPHVATVHSLEPLRPWKEEQLGGGYRLSSFCERTGLEDADAIIAVSGAMRDDILAVYPAIEPGRVTVIGNGIDTDEFRPDHGTDRSIALGHRPRRADRPLRRPHHAAEGPPPPPRRRARARPGRPARPLRQRARHAGARRGDRRARSRRSSATGTRCSGSRRCCRAATLIQLLTPRHRLRLPVGLRAARDREPRGDGLRDGRRRDRARAASRRWSTTASPGCSSRSSRAATRSGEPADPDAFAHALAERINALLADPGRAPALRAGRPASGRSSEFGWDAIAERVAELYQVRRSYDGAAAQEAPRHGSRSSRSRRSSTAAATRRSETARREFEVTRDDLRRRPRRPARGRPLPRARRPTLDGGAARPLGNDRWEGSFPVDVLGRWQYAIDGLGRPLRLLAPRARAQGRGRPGRPRERARRGRGAARRPSAHARARRSRPSPTYRARPRRLDAAARADRRPRARARSAPGTSSSPAPSAASPGVEKALPRARRARLRRPLLPADPPDRRRRTARAATTRSTAEAGRPGQPLGDRRRRGRARGGRARARDDRRPRAARRGRRPSTGSRSRSTSRSSARPTIRGSQEHPEWFQRRPDGTLKYAENPPKRYQDIYNLDFASEDWRGALAGAPRPRARLGGARHPDLPRRQPAHEADRVLGVADPGGAGACTPTSCSSPRRSRARR